MSETSETGTETYERYVLLTSPAQVSLIDSFTNAAIRTFKGADALERALAFHERYNSRWELSQGHGCSLYPGAPLAEEAGEPAETVPAEDMTVTQPIARPTGVVRAAQRAAGVVGNMGPFRSQDFVTASVPTAAKRERLTVALAEVKRVEAEVLELLKRDQRELDRATALRLRLETALMAVGNGLSSTESAERAEVVPASTPTEFEVGESILWASWNGPRSAKVLRVVHGDNGEVMYFVQVESNLTHPALAGFRGWIPANELHHVGD